MIRQFFKILAIDNDPDNLVLLKSIIAEAFTKVTFLSAQSGKEGIVICRAEKPDVILLAIRMPGLDGYEVCNILKSDPVMQRIPVVMLTAISESAASRTKAMYSGADGFLAKPVNESELIVQIRTMIRLKESEDRKSTEQERLGKEVKERTAALEKELQERKKAEEALQHSLIRLEKSRYAELNLLEDLRNEIIQRRDAEDALRESRQQLLNIIDFLPDATFVVDNDIKVIAWNKAMEDMTGVQKSEMIGKGDNAYAIPFYGKNHKQLLDFIDSDDNEIIARYSNVCRNGLSLSAEIFAPALYGGKGAHISVLGAPLFNSLGERLGSIESIRDITERKLGEVALRDKEALLHTLVQTIPALIWLKDINGIFLSCNTMFERLIGASEADIVGKTDYDFVDSALADFFRENDRKAMVADKSTSNEEWVTFADDGHRAFLNTIKTPMYDSAGKLIGVLGVGHDITERNLAGEALRENEEKYRFMFAYNPQPMWIYDLETLVFLEVNQAAMNHYGYSREEFLRMTLRDIRPVEDLPELEKDIELTRNNFNPAGEWRHIKKNGEVIIVEITSHSVISEGRKARHVLINDITARKQAEKEIHDLAKFPSENPGPILRITLDGKLQYINPSGNDLLKEWKLKTGHVVHALLREAVLRTLEKNSKQVLDLLCNELVYEFSFVPVIDSGYVYLYGRDITERNRAEKALRESESRAQAMLSAIPDLMFRIDRQGIFLDYRADVNELYAQSLPTIIGKYYRDITPKEFADLIEQEIRITLETGKLQTFEYQLPLPHRGIRDYEARMIGSGADEVTAIVRDITDRKHAENAVRESEALYRNLVQRLPDGVYKSTHEGKFVEVNPAMVRILGYASKEELLAIDIKTQLYFEPADRESLVLQEKFEEMAVYPLRKKDGTMVWIEDHAWYNLDDKGNMLFHEGIMRDVTERIKAEEALRESEALYRNLVLKLPDGVYKSTPEGRFVDVNPAMVKMLGYESREELMAIDIKTQLYFELTDRESIVLQEKMVEMGTYRLKKKDGSEIWIEDHGWYNLDENGQILYHEGIMRDITDRKRAQDEIVLLNEELEQRVHQRTLQLENTNKELEAFSYSVSHDLRAPLRGIDGWSLALLEDYNHLLDDKGRVYIGRVRSESQRMGTLIDDLLKLSRVNRIDMKQVKVDISAIAQTIADRLRESHATKQCEFIIEPGLVEQGDPQMLEIALTNLFDNAFKFTGAKEFSKIEFGSLQIDGITTYFVRDNGVGFDMEYAKKLFGAFQRMHKQSDFPGSGIGLATVKRIISRHGGRVWADSTPGEGSVFYFTINES